MKFLKTRIFIPLFFFYSLKRITLGLDYEEKLLNITDLTHIIFKLNKYRLFIE
jgi:hypothetical protein